LGALFATHKNLINITAQGLLALALLSLLFWSSPLKMVVFYLLAFYGCLYLSSTSFFMTKLKLPADPSYGVYIYGFVIQQCLAHIFPDQGVSFNRTFGVLIAVVVGFLSWRYIEKPSLSFVKRTIEQNFYLLHLRSNVMSQLKKAMELVSTKPLGMVAGLLLITWLMHFIAFSFVFPGYYRPLSFQHSDFYIPAAFAFAPNDYYSFASLLHWPRPLFMWFYKFTGYFGHAGSVAWVVAIVFINCTFTAMFFKRLLGLQSDLKFYLFFAAYCFVLFTQPYFYTFYTQDIGSQLSYLLLLSGFFAFHLLSSRTLVGSAMALFGCCVCAFLVKETYILSFAFVAFCWFIYYVRTDIKIALTPGIAVGLSAIIVAVVNLKTKSVFVNLNAKQGSDYQMDLNIASVFKELMLYGKEAIGYLLIIAFLFALYALFAGRKNKLLLSGFFICMGFAVFAWLPNAFLPFHHYPGYSFNGLYVCFASVFILLKFWQEQQEQTRFKPMYYMFFVLLIVSPLANFKKYKDDRNQWVLAMEDVQRNMLKGFRQATGQLESLDKPISVLITGINSPFHPFAFPESIRSFSGGDRATYYFVVPHEFPAKLGEKIDLVQFISDADKNTIVADQEWQFDQSGRLVAVLKNKITSQ
jgi:hypothetical protein